VITYFKIFGGVLFWTFSLAVLVASFYTPNIYTGICVFLLGLVNLSNAIAYMDDSFTLDTILRKKIAENPLVNYSSEHAKHMAEKLGALAGADLHKECLYQQTEAISESAKGLSEPASRT